ncbi:hypothetical protein Zmor_001873 [Zophobas morio]|uniref:Uncharacterized protein n=1 Tax=Zophobas morio TaxID=2755281 RepID=A0AA38J653_9CUCU|nr:hypothetical protein Zmor_001873 [Zophobas morio]
MQRQFSYTALMFQISTWRPSRTKATHSTKPWGWEAWALCSAVYMLAAAPTASPGPPTTETAALRRATSDLRAVSGPRHYGGSRFQTETSARVGVHTYSLCQ